MDNRTRRGHPWSGRTGAGRGTPLRRYRRL